MRDYVLMYVNGQRHEVRGGAVFQPLSDFLRGALRLTGTKVVCAEGDCGACVVLVGRPRDGRIEYQPLASCIQYVAQLDGAHVVTVEGLSYDGRLNPVQEAMVAHHGAQCGYCTPGFVVSLCSLFEQSPNPSRHEVGRALVGNLCRCTGYASILESAARVDGTAQRSIDDLYPSDRMLPEMDRAAAESVELIDGKRRLFKPATLDEAVTLRAAIPAATTLAGGTDLGVVWNKNRLSLGESASFRGAKDDILCIGELNELRECKLTDGLWSIGAGTTIAELERLAAEALPSYAELLERFGSPPIKNAGTFGGNLANGSPIGDTMPALFVLDAEVELIGPRGTRRVNLNRFYTGYRQSVMAADELIRRVLVRQPGENERFAVYKISKRRDLDISSFTAAIWMHIEGDVIRRARIAYGGVAPTIVRLPKTEAWLCERRLTESTMRQAGKFAREEIAPISDVRGSARYRSQLAENILVKFARQYGERASASHNGY